jgi:hypothetical protein
MAEVEASEKQEALFRLSAHVTSRCSVRRRCRTQDSVSQYVVKRKPEIHSYPFITLYGYSKIDVLSDENPH